MIDDAVRAKLKALRQENEDLRREIRLLLGGYKVGGGLAALVLLGPGLVTAARAYFERSTPAEPIPPRESADLFAAIVRRVVAVGVLGLVVAGTPVVLLWQQNGLLAAQNQYFQEQNAKIQEQLDDQAADTLLVRRNELLRTIYETKDCKLPNGATTDGATRCPPAHSPRLRAEALLALAELFGPLELSGAELSDVVLVGSNLTGFKLPGADLSGADLSGADLSGADLSGANLYEAYLIEADLSGAELSFARLSGASLGEASLAGANFSASHLDNADLRSAILRDTHFDYADLSGAQLGEAEIRDTNFYYARLAGTDLRDVDLTHARNLEEEQLFETCGDLETKAPDTIRRPAHWLDRHSYNVFPEGCPPESNKAEQ